MRPSRDRAVGRTELGEFRRSFKPMPELAELGPAYDAFAGPFSYLFSKPCLAGNAVNFSPFASDTALA